MDHKNYKRSTESKKHMLVTSILAQRTHATSSYLWCRLYNQLMKLSKDDLAALDMLIAIKVTDCGGEGLVDLTDEMQGRLNLS